MSNHMQNLELDKTKVLPYQYSFHQIHNCVDSITSPNSYLKQGRFTGLFTIWLLGNGTLFAWNNVITIGDYYAFLFPMYHPMKALTFVYQSFALVTTAILAYHEARLNTRCRNLLGYSLFFSSSLGLIVLDLATMGKGGLGIFIGVCIAKAIFGVACGYVAGGMVGDISLMCPKLIISFMAGFATAGTLTATLRLITKAAFESSDDGLRKGAMLFLTISTSFELICVFLYAFIFPKLPIVKYYRAKAAFEGSKTVTADLAAAGIQLSTDDAAMEDPNQFERLSNKELLLQNIDYALDIFLIYVLTLSIFLGFIAEDTRSHSLGSWYTLVLITMYHVWDLVGGYVPLLKPVKLVSRKGLIFACLSRFLFIPAFYFTAKHGDQGWMIMLTPFLGLSHGYLSVCIFSEAPKGYKGPEQNALGNLLSAVLTTGIFLGVGLSWLWLIGKGL
ncbi:equilibrative nucleotide transporter 3-like [Zingiber officinale]|uniref:equilibrative nucleotide transporter 3-like n=1 Tax=Zingiber officinale TaxID=94328 RepID=UPI001C4CC578|nr:equilibrative nucleotide transporter 3-like [Zingiber officinale]